MSNWFNDFTTNAAMGIFNNLFGGAQKVNDTWNFVDPTGSGGVKEQYDYNLALQQDAQAYNSAEAEKNRQWQEKMSNTAYQRAFNDLKAAGYNPYLALTAGSSASTPSGGAASSSASSVSRRDNQLPSYANTLSNLANNLVKAGTSSAKTASGVLSTIGKMALLAMFM